MRHWEILKKYIDTYETQQKVLEHALESLDNGSRPEEKASSHGMPEGSMAPVQKYSLLMLIDCIDLDKIADYMVRVKPPVYALEYFYHKPIKECSEKEVIDGVVIVSRVVGLYDSVDCEDNGDHYTFKINHSLGMNGSKIAKMANDALFDLYGLKTEAILSEKGLVQKIYKKS